MELFFDMLRSIVYGVIEGVTEWLPISSTGHMILAEQVLKFSLSAEFMEMFRVVIQLGAILAVVVLYFKKLWPFCSDNGRDSGLAKHIRWPVMRLWGKILVACLPAAVLGLLLDDWMDAHLYNYITVAIALIAYGAAFILVERSHANKKPAIEKVGKIDYKTALLIGCFQCLSLIPGTSRSGSTILGAILLGVSRPAAAEFSFFMAIPTMVGASGLKALKFIKAGTAMTGNETMVLIVGCVVSFLVSLFIIRSLMEYVRKHSFSAFGVYRIILGALVLAYFLISSLVK